MRGYLRKRTKPTTRLWQRWQRRYFVFDPSRGTLSYFNSSAEALSPSGRPRGQVQVVGVRIGAASPRACHGAVSADTAALCFAAVGRVWCDRDRDRGTAGAGDDEAGAGAGAGAGAEGEGGGDGEAALEAGAGVLLCAASVEARDAWVAALRAAATTGSESSTGRKGSAREG